MKPTLIVILVKLASSLQLYLCVLLQKIDG